MTDSSEEKLTGGVVNTVVRIGQTVRRTTGPWTPTIHSLLDHLERAGFPYSPRVRGIDEHDREVLTYIEGTPAMRPWPHVLHGEESLHTLGRMLRELTDAVQKFDPPPEAVWRTSPAGPPLPGGSIRHGDMGMWNTIWNGDRLVGLIDWDFAEPAPPLWDLAQTAWYAVPFYRGEDGWQSCGFTAEPDHRRRFAALCDAYGAEREAVLDALVELQATERHRVATLGAAGIAPFQDFLARGDLAELDEEAAWLAARRTSLLSG